MCVRVRSGAPAAVVRPGQHLCEHHSPKRCETRCRESGTGVSRIQRPRGGSSQRCHKGRPLDSGPFLAPSPGVPQRLLLPRSSPCRPQHCRHRATARPPPAMVEHARAREHTHEERADGAAVISHQPTDGTSDDAEASARSHAEEGGRGREGRIEAQGRPAPPSKYLAGGVRSRKIFSRLSK